MDCWAKEFIRRVINAMERQTDSIMVRAQWRVQASEPELDIMAVTLQGGIWACRRSEGSYTFLRTGEA